jgi:DNA mismatch repair ATPase MutS
MQEWQALANAASTLDVLSSFATFAAVAEGPTCMPTFVAHGDAGPVLHAQDMWHPALAHANGQTPVANDLRLGSLPDTAEHNAAALLLTGPNMVR